MFLLLRLVFWRVRNLLGGSLVVLVLRLECLEVAEVAAVGPGLVLGQQVR